MATTTTTYTTIAYLKRAPHLSLDEFYAYWAQKHAAVVAPWLEKYGFKSYRQVHQCGFIGAGDGEKAAVAPLQRFDGIAIFEYAEPDLLLRAMKDEYYTAVVEPDEHNVIDKTAGPGIVARYVGEVVQIVAEGKSSVADK